MLVVNAAIMRYFAVSGSSGLLASGIKKINLINNHYDVVNTLYWRRVVGRAVRDVKRIAVRHGAVGMDDIRGRKSSVGAAHLARRRSSSTITAPRPVVYSRTKFKLLF